MKLTGKKKKKEKTILPYHEAAIARDRRRQSSYTFIVDPVAREFEYLQSSVLCKRARERSGA
jgi:hypothetical protein